MIIANVLGLLFAVSFAFEFEFIVKIFASAFVVWQFTNSIVSTYYIYSHSTNEHLKVLIKVSMYIMAVLSILVFIGSIIW